MLPLRTILLLVPLVLAAAAPPGEAPATPLATTFVSVPGAPVVVDVTPLPDGSLLLGSQTDGKVWRVSPAGVLQPTPVIDLPSSPPVGEYGLLGLALHPAYPAEPWVYAFYTETNSNPVLRQQRIVRFDFPPGATVAGAVQDVVTGIPSGALCCHNGGRVDFGPDGMLYATLGENFVSPTAQNPYDPRGSVLRYTPTGAIPADNPYPTSPVAVTGIRNAFGLTFDPVWGMVVTDNGPSGLDGPGGFDEVSLLEVGDNAGWPLSRGPTVLPGTVGPLWQSGNAHIAPTGVVVPRGSAVPAWDGKIVWCNYNDGVARLLDPAVPNPQPVSVFSPCHFDVQQDAFGRLVFATFKGVTIVG